MSKNLTAAEQYKENKIKIAQEIKQKVENRIAVKTIGWKKELKELRKILDRVADDMIAQNTSESGDGTTLQDLYQFGFQTASKLEMCEKILERA